MRKTQKTVYALFLVALVFGLTPIVAAEQNNFRAQSNGNGKTLLGESDGSNTFKEFGAEDDDNTDDESDKNFKNSEADRERLKEANEHLKEVGERLKEQATQAKKRIQVLAQNHEQIKLKYEQQKNVLSAAKKKVTCDINMEECKELRKEYRAQAHRFLLRAADVVINQLERVIEKVKNDPNMSNEKKEELLNDLNEKLDQVLDAKALIEEKGEDLTEDELAKIVEILRNAWTNSNRSIKSALGSVLNHKAKTIISKMINLESKLERVIEKRESQGQDMTKAWEYLEDFSENVEMAEEKYEEAKKKWLAAHTVEDVIEAGAEAEAFMRESYRYMKQAQEVLKKLLGELRVDDRPVLDVGGVNTNLTDDDYVLGEDNSSNNETEYENEEESDDNETDDDSEFGEDDSDDNETGDDDYELGEDDSSDNETEEEDDDSKEDDKEDSEDDS